MLNLFAAMHKLNFVHNYFGAAKRNLPYYIFRVEISLPESSIFHVGKMRKTLHIL